MDNQFQKTPENEPQTDNVLDILMNNIPDEMRQRPQWVCYRLEERGGKLTKVPYQTTGGPGQNARTDDPATWSTFDEAVGAVREHANGYQGVGFVLSDTDPYVFIDLDHVIVDGQIEPWAQDIITRAQSFTELSQSGTGAHIIARASKPGTRCRISRHPKFEIYERLRFVVFTGRVLPGLPTEIVDAQDAVNEIYSQIFGGSDCSGAERRTTPTSPVTLPDDVIIEKAASARNGNKFRLLWDGDTSGYNGDDSAADLGLCCMLAFWTGNNRAQMDRIFRRSGLIRDKWDERRGDRTYGQSTLDAAISHNSEVYCPSARNHRTADRQPAADNGEETQAAIDAARQLVEDAIKAKSPEMLFENIDILSAIPVAEYHMLRAKVKKRFGRALRVTALDEAIQENRPRGGEKPGKADLLLAHVRPLISRAFRTVDGEGYLIIDWQEKCLVIPVQSSDLVHLLHKCWETIGNGSTIGNDHIKTVVAHLEADTWSSGDVQEVYTRVAGKDGAVYVDLANDRNEIVKITADGWSVITDQEVAFRRGSGTLALPTPEHGGDLADLRRFVNIPDESEWRLFVGFLVGCFNPRPPYPVLSVGGEQGSGKSTLTRLAKMLTDPGQPMLRMAPENPKAIISAAQNSRVLAYSNLSDIPRWLSDLLCCLSTDGGYSTKTLYKTLDETVFDGKRPVIVNGIGDLVWSGDLLDRCIQVELQPISETDRQEEECFWRDFEAVRPQILGALLDAVSCAQRRKDSIHLERKPRMADFARWVVAAEPALPWGEGGFLDAYFGNRQCANESTIASDPVARRLVEFIQEQPDHTWVGTAEQLHSAMNPAPAFTSQGKIVKGTPPSWYPATAASLGRKLVRLAPNLRGCGCDIAHGKRDHKRMLIITFPGPGSTDGDTPVSETAAGGLETAE